VAPQASLEIFERAATARGRLLRIEADRAVALPRILALTFDVGRIVLRAEAGEVRAEGVPERSALPPGLVPLDEEEPWWRVLGQPITAAWPVGGGETGPVETALALRALKLRFREPDQNPRIVAVAAAGPALRITLEGN
jgi:hypothetical protein